MEKQLKSSQPDTISKKNITEIIKKENKYDATYQDSATNLINELNSREINSSNKEILKAFLEKEIKEIYENVFVPVLNEMETFKKDLETKIKTKKFGNTTEKTEATQLKIVHDSLEKFISGNITARIKEALNNISTEFNIIIDDAIENKENNIETHLDKVMEVILDIYLEMQKAQIDLVEKIISLEEK